MRWDIDCGASWAPIPGALRADGSKVPYCRSAVDTLHGRGR